MVFRDRIFTVLTQARDVERGVDKEAFGEFQPIVVGTDPVVMVKGPSRLTSSFLVGHVVEMLLASSQTLSPTS